MTVSLSERYVLLGLRIGRHVDGIVDAYFGPESLAAAVDAAAPVEPGELVTEADALLDELEDGWLHDQVVGLRTYAGVLAGEHRSYADEVEGCYGVRPIHTDEQVFADAHAALETLLPGAGSLAERFESWRSSSVVPVEKIEGLVGAVIEVARRWTRDIVELPAGEGIEVRIVRDEPWLAFNHYLGGLRSRIEVNVDLPLTALELIQLALHEAYPGHHAERCCKEQLLVQERGLLDESIVMVPTPQSLVAEGIAELGHELLLDGPAGSALAAILDDAGFAFDLPHALQVQRAREPCAWGGLNASMMLQDGASEAETRAYLERWTLASPDVAAHAIRFFLDPTSRTYVITYFAGRDLCRAYVDGDPQRFRRLLTEQVRVRELLAPRAA